MTSVGLYRVRVTLTGAFGTPGLSTCYFAEPTSGNSTAAGVVAGRVRGAWDVIKSSLASTMVATVQPAVDFVDPATGNLMTSFVISPPAIVTSTGANQGPTQVMGGLELDTATVLNNHRLRGRLFIGPLSQASMAGNAPPGALGANLDAMGVALITISPPATNPLVVWHRPVNHANGQDFPVLSAVHATKFFTLRSRLN